VGAADDAGGGGAAAADDDGNDDGFLLWTFAAAAFGFSNTPLCKPRESLRFAVCGLRFAVCGLRFQYHLRAILAAADPPAAADGVAAAAAVGNSNCLGYISAACMHAKAYGGLRLHIVTCFHN